MTHAELQHSKPMGFSNVTMFRIVCKDHEIPYKSRVITEEIIAEAMLDNHERLYHDNDD